MLIGYARVSTGDQNLDLQKNALIRAEERRRRLTAAATGRCAGGVEAGQAGPQRARSYYARVGVAGARGEFPQPDRLD